MIAYRNRCPEQRRSGLGSGVIISTDGYILTNHHVIDGAEQIKVDLNDNRTLDAKVVGSDQPRTLAVLKIDATNLPVLALGDPTRYAWEMSCWPLAIRWASAKR